MSREAMKLALEALETVAADVKTTPTAYEAQRQAITALREALVNEALDKKAENARELGLDYEPSAGTHVSKVWWDGEKLMAKPIPFVEFYKPAQRTWVGLTEPERLACYDLNPARFASAIEAKLKEKNT